MIEIIREEKKDDAKELGGLPKDIKQMGNPDIGERIYVENRVYQYMHPYQNHKEETAYVLLGRFENYAGKQCVFVEAAIRLEEIEFEAEIPVWNDQTWAYIYQQLKHEYDSMVIVGWALDIKGQLPNMTAKIEALHQNNFGGPHQVLFLMDSLEQEETFYCSRNEHLYRREGFYVYYRKTGSWAQDMEEAPAVERQSAMEQAARAGEPVDEAVQTPTAGDETGGFYGEELRFSESDLNYDRKADGKRSFRRELFRNRGSYRQQLNVQKKREWNGSYAYTGLLVAIVCALGATVYQNYQKLGAMEATIAQMNGNQIEDTEKAGITVEKVTGNVEKQTEAQTALSDQLAAPTDSSISTNITDGSEGNSEAGMGAADTGTADAGAPGITDVETLGTGTAGTELPDAGAADAGTPGAETVPDAENGVQVQAADSGQTEAMAEAQIYLEQGYYIVQKGDSLIGICRKIYQTTAMMEKLCEVNNIEDMDAIYAGQYLTLPN